MSKTKNVYIYDIPPVVLYDFTRIMDSLSHSVWMGFASRVVLDQTELRLTERCEDRTSRLLNWWGCRNGTVADLLNILEDLRMYRARDIILNWMQSHSSPSEQPPLLPAWQSSSLPPAKSFPSFPPSSSWHQPIKEYTKAVSESRRLPLPSPPPQASQVAMSLGGRQPTALPGTSSSEPASLKSEDLYNSLSSCAMCWSFEEILKGTDSFSSAHQIGEGGFGVVYRATMRNTDYAVKKLKKDSQLDWTLVKQSFKTEVEKLSLYRHPNILDFAGYAIGEGTHCLLYIFMPNGSLEDRLHCQDSAALSWCQRVSVVLGAAKALQFLHTCSPKVIHGDVKSSNILLGEHLESKLGDFGLARLCQNPGRATGKTTTVAQTKTIRGTLAYLPDEYLKDGQLGVEIDIYSFGVVLLEVLTGRRALEATGQSKAVYLKDLVSEFEDGGRNARTGKSSDSISTAAQHICRNQLDSKVATPSSPVPSGALEIAHLACQCLHRRRKKRPPMDEIFRTLQANYKDPTYTCRSTINASSDLPQLPAPQIPASVDISVETLRSQFTKLGPEEDTYCCTQHVQSISSMVSPSSSIDQSKETSAMTFSHHFPCESDESQGFSQYFSTPDPSSKTYILGAVRSHGASDYTLSASQADLSPISSAPDGGVRSQSQDPVESEESEY